MIKYRIKSYKRNLTNFTKYFFLQKILFFYLNLAALICVSFVKSFYLTSLQRSGCLAAKEILQRKKLV